MKNIGAGIAVAATYGFTGFLISSPGDTSGIVLLALVVFAAICTWKLVAKSDE